MSDNHPSWRDGAACAQVDPQLWFPEKGGQASEARKICAGCGSRVECLNDAMRVELGLPHGMRGTVRGGMGASARAAYEASWLELQVAS